MEGYKYLSSYILATVICDLTAKFCQKYIDPRSRTTDQMIQAARSGKQNIAEGYSVQSLESYIKLLGVAEGSMRELAIDYEDYLRQHQFPTWAKDDQKIRVFRDFRAVWKTPNNPNTPNLPDNPTEAANMLLTFCQMDTFLMSRQLMIAPFPKSSRVKKILLTSLFRFSICRFLFNFCHPFSHLSNQIRKFAAIERVN